MTGRRDAVIIGAGHNGLIAGYYLARAGLKPLILERRAVVGGAAITDEFHPGFKCPTLAHSCGPVRSEVIRDMRLDRHGLELIQPEPSVFVPSPQGHGLVLYSDPVRSAQEVAKLSQRDAKGLGEFHRVLSRVAAFIHRLMLDTPPAIESPRAGDLWNLLRTAWALRALGEKDIYRLLRWAPMPVADLVGEWFETDLLQAVVAARGIFGSFLGPRSPGSGAILLARAGADPHPAGSTAFAKGGMGTLTQAMASVAIEAGAEVRTESEAARINVKDGKASGVTLSSGEEITAKAVISSADPRHTFLRLIDSLHLEPDFLLRVKNYRCVGTVAKVNLALAGLPSFTALARGGGPEKLAGRIHIAPDIDYLERAFDDAKYASFSRQPYLEATLPSIADPSLAPPGRHVMSVYVQFAPYTVNDGWSSQRAALGDTVIKTLAAYAADLPGLVLHRQVITPLDLEETYGLTGGHIFHGELALDQLFAMRPFLGCARYRTPIKNLYLCGSGTHPGIGLTGASGHNAARELLKDWKKLSPG